MPQDVFLPNGKPTLRQGMLTRLMFEVLAEAAAPIKAGAAVKRIGARFDPTPHEASLNKTGVPRWETYVRWTSSWAKSIGWIDKGTGFWSLTDAGRAAADDYPGDALDTEIGARYAALRAAAKASAADAGPAPLMERALDALGPGSWTTYGDLAQLTGYANQGVGTAMKATAHEAAHRVLQSDGTLSPSFTWSTDRDDDPRAVLEEEGLEFDEDGHADLGSRLTVDDFRELLGVETPARAWLIRGSVNGVNLVPTWLRHDFCSLPAGQATQVTADMDRTALSALVEREYSDKSYAARSDKVTELDAFLNRMQIDDVIATVNDGECYLGRITGHPDIHPDADDRSNLRRSVTWVNAAEPVDYADLPKALTAKLSQQRTIVDLTSERRTLEGYFPTRSDDPAPTPAVPHLEGVSPATPELATANHVDQAWLQEVIDLLWDRRQLIFYGPPGTGKTYLARAIAHHLTDAQNVKLVQFHPSYSYEDFFEGYRPGAPTEDGRVSFTLTPGPFRRLVDVAREDPGTPYVLIIDEINRANLAKVFGELYFLLEYRDESVDLLYAAGDDSGFSLPDNVFLIGTMNTADRSIALVDAAMRRRFAFVHLHPAEPPTSGILRRWLSAEGKDAGIADLHDALNTRIEDPDFKIGPSYFMRPEVHRTPAGIERMWRTAILPLLEEHHYGEGLGVAAYYDLDTIRRTVRSGAVIAPGENEGTTPNHPTAPRKTENLPTETGDPSTPSS
ncbi:AAA family ATPase [Mobilicoccus pelagius]|uniref:Putative McrBC restriction endonuclease system protein McrB n=1 Tax=Mobilicoccus pelagius NBRC 104925 TaxID=1089455 RepID=H5UMM0_9MICO|nr:AAA family ATPase [Mobilicoccus pelagius]GAB46978.1 putative McrBC restriction endonuclease system protein McrB [Mobilicoccus pelagius NBRC 104925]